VTIGSVGLLREYVKEAYTNFLSLYFRPSLYFLRPGSPPIFTQNGSKDVDSPKE